MADAAQVVDPQLRLALRANVTTDAQLEALVHDADPTIPLLRQFDDDDDDELGLGQNMRGARDASLSRLVVDNTLGNGAHVYATLRGDAIVLRVEGRVASFLNVLIRRTEGGDKALDASNATIVTQQAVQLALATPGVTHITALVCHISVMSQAGQPLDDSGWNEYAYEDGLVERMNRQHDALTSVGLGGGGDVYTWSRRRGLSGPLRHESYGGYGYGYEGGESSSADNPVTQVNVFERRLLGIETDNSEMNHVAQPHHALTWLASRPHVAALTGYRIVDAPRPGGDGILDRVQVLAYRPRFLSPSIVHGRIVLEPLLINACPHVRARWLADAVRVMCVNLWKGRGRTSTIEEYNAAGPHTVGVLVDGGNAASEAVFRGALAAGGFTERAFDRDAEDIAGPTGAPLPLRTTLYALRFADEQALSRRDAVDAVGAAVATAPLTNADETAYREYWVRPPTVQAQGGGGGGGGKRRREAGARR